MKLYKIFIILNFLYAPLARLQQRKQQEQQQLFANTPTSVKCHLVMVSDLDAIS
jgi:hypothetical protein